MRTSKGMQQWTVAVEQDHIDAAVRRDSHRCMIANAVAAQIPGAKYVQVDLQSVRFSNTEKGKRYIYMTPPQGQKALLAFDRGKKQTPFKLTLAHGHTRSMRVRDPGYVPIPRSHYRNKKSRHMPSRYREFGLRQYETTK